MKPTKELITRIKKLRDTDGLNFREISEHLKIVDNLDITRQSAERIYKTNPDVKVWSKWSLFANQWKKEIEAGASINQVAKEYGVRPKVVWYQMKKIGVVSTAKSGPKIKKKEGITVKITKQVKLQDGRIADLETDICGDYYKGEVWVSKTETQPMTELEAEKAFELPEYQRTINFQTGTMGW